MSCYLISGCHRNRGIVGCLRSIAILERYCRKDGHNGDLDYQMLIVLKSNTDPKEIEILRNKLVGMIGRVPVCNTDSIEKLLLVKLP